GYAQGADDYVAKPFELSLLRARIVNLLENRKRLQEQYSRQIFLGPSQLPLSTPEAEFIQKMAAVIEERMEDEQFSVDELAQRMGFSRAHFYRKVAALVGQSPQQIIMEMRLQRGLRLLQSRQLTIAEIAYRIGFHDPAHFSKAFKKRFGCPPSRFNA
ncbi:MAG: helix-turn-helix domain-containing protein, partial [candidate division KSB1 bacterium]|nr:helix-turn-helix domain-containing protein [candidate division KSB1 bacterium]